MLRSPLIGRHKASCESCMPSRFRCVSVLRPFALQWRAAGRTCSFSGARTLPPEPLPSVAASATGMKPHTRPRTSCLAPPGLGCSKPAGALLTPLRLMSHSMRQQLSTAYQTAMPSPCRHALGAAAGPDAASAAQEIGRRAAERVKDADPQMTDDWGGATDSERWSSAQPSSGSSASGRYLTSAASSGRSGNQRSAAVAKRVPQQLPADDHPDTDGGGDGRARRYLDRIAGLKAVPEDYNRDLLSDDWMEPSTAPPELAAGSETPALTSDSAAAPARAEHHAAEVTTSAGSAAILGDNVGTDTGTPAARQPTHIRVKSAAFVKSSMTLEQCPPASLPELAVIGRSNVGKSSLINALTNQSSLAKVSKTPGKTTCINHFLINDCWYLVDLPGYGYARRSKEARLEWGAFTQAYFLERPTLAAVLLLVDASVPPQQLDLVCVDWLAEAEVPFALVYTKMDKRKKRVPSPDDNITAFEEAVTQRWEVLPPSVRISAHTGGGKGELLLMMAELRELYKQHSPGASPTAQ